MSVKEFRIALTIQYFKAAFAFYRDGLGSTRPTCGHPKTVVKARCSWLGGINLRWAVNVIGVSIVMV